MKERESVNSYSYLGYEPGNTFVHKLSGTTKLLAFLALSLVTMTTFDTRYLIGVGILSIIIFYTAHLSWESIRLPMKLVFWFSVLNLVMIYIFSPEQGVHIYGTRHIIWEGFWRYNLTWEQLLYLFNVGIKYLTTIPLAFIFILTTHPSEFASSLNKIGVSYKISYAISLALRYIPDIQEEYFTILQAQQARGIEISKKASTVKRLKRSASIAIPLIFSSLERIEVIAQAMELRRFGKNNKRTWYSYRPFHIADIIALIITGIIVGLGILLLFYNNGRFWNPFIN